MTDKDALHLVMQEELSVSRSYNGSRTFYKKLCRYNRIMIAIIGGMLGLEGFLIGIFYALGFACGTYIGGKLSRRFIKGNLTIMNYELNDLFTKKYVIHNPRISAGKYHK